MDNIVWCTDNGTAILVEFKDSEFRYNVICVFMREIT